MAQGGESLIIEEKGAKQTGSGGAGLLKRVMTQNITMAALAEALGGRLVGDGSVVVSRIAHPSDIRGAGDLALAMEAALVPLLQTNGAAAALVSEGAEVPVNVKAAIFVGRSRYAMSKLNALFEQKVAVPKGIHPMAFVEEGAVIGKDVAIGAFSYVCAGARIGDGSILHPQVYIGPDVELGAEALVYSGTRIGARVKIGARAIIHFNASIGADGFSFVTPQMGSVEAAKATGAVGEMQNTQLVRIASLGAVEIGDDVEIGANTSIDRGTIVSTRIGSGTKLDNQVQIGHNVVVGENCMLCGRSGVAGSSVLGNRVVLGGAVGVADHLTVGDDVICMGMSGIAGNVPPRSVVGGIPAKPRKKMIEDMFNLNRIKGLVDKVKVLSKRVDELEGKG